jgi:hypothetical protein
MLVSKFAYPELTRIDSSEEGRKYNTPSGILPSVTTILSATKSAQKIKALEMWRENIGNKEADRILMESSNIGTIIHKHVERFSLGEERPSGTNLIHVNARKLADVLIEKGMSNVSEIYGVEIPLYYPSLYAGTTDCVGLHKGELAIIDFKNSRKVKKEEYVEDYKTQLVAYAEAHNMVYGTNIKKGVIMMVVRGDTVASDFGKYQEWVLEGEEFKKHQEIWAKAVDKYYNSSNS